MPIKGLTESRRLPRLGKIHLGIKKQAKSKAWYPSATEYFVVPESVAGVVGEKPTELPILFPIEDEEIFASQFYRSYSMTRGLVCRGDGETCRRMVDTKTGEMANRDSKDIVWKDGLPCDGKQCPYYGRGKQCKETMCLQFLLPTCEGLGVWQIDTSSINSIRNLNSAIELIRGVYGRISMLPLLLTLEPIEVVNPDDGKKKTVRVLNLRTKGTMIELMERAVKPAREMLLPAPLDTEPPEDMEMKNGVSLPVPEEGPPPDLIMPQTQAPADQEQAEKDAKELWPEASGEKKEPPQTKALAKTSQAKPAPAPAEKAKPIINMEWLKESLGTLRAKKLSAYTESNLLSYMKTSYKVEAKTVLEAVAKLDKGQAAHFVKRIQDTLDMA
ncbi:hypothetical protein ES703_35145 [subsurface metagenome]